MAELAHGRREQQDRHPRLIAGRTHGAGTADRESSDLSPDILARFLHALADPTRVRILESLSREGELHVSALVARLAQPQGRVSAHLTCLRTCGLVRVRQHGKFRYYALADHRIPALLALARELARPHAEAIASCTLAARHDRSEDS
ncbi:MAG: metalloregulator ArsR/SmtB family transcription factor [Thermomicrobium sp.]|nr:metalloregulator ArsR/SmtB family transcription factor [Thermomicrobium sp.]MDW8058721.1 metalloregulator ArsR/SmtB family transcription factor [Thermomicrobium sp.]